MVLFYWTVLNPNFSDFVLWVGISIGRKWKRVLIIMLFCWCSNSDFFNATGQNSSRIKVSIVKFFVRNVFFWKNSFVVNSISPFCAPLMEIIAVRLRHLFPIITGCWRFWGIFEGEKNRVTETMDSCIVISRSHDHQLWKPSLNPKTSWCHIDGCQCLFA